MNMCNYKTEKYDCKVSWPLRSDKGFPLSFQCYHMLGRHRKETKMPQDTKPHVRIYLRLTFL